MSETAAPPAVKPRKRVQDRWWWPWLVVSLFVLSIGTAPPWTVWAFEQVGVAIEWLQQTNCDIAGATNCP